MTRKGGRPAKLTRLGYELARFRRSRGLTDKSTAAMLGVARSTISRYLRGECRQYEDAR